MPLQPYNLPAPGAEVEFLDSDWYLTDGITLDAALVAADANGDKIIKAGTVIARVTATGLSGPIKATTVTANAASGQKNVSLTNAQFFRVGDVIVVGTEAPQAIAAVNYDTGVVTMTENLAANQNAGVSVKGSGGLGTARGVLMHTINLRHGPEAAAILTRGRVKKLRPIGYVAAVDADLPLVEFR